MDNILKNMACNLNEMMYLFAIKLHENTQFQKLKPMSFTLPSYKFSKIPIVWNSLDGPLMVACKLSSD